MSRPNVRNAPAEDTNIGLLSKTILGNLIISLKPNILLSLSIMVIVPVPNTSLMKLISIKDSVYDKPVWKPSFMLGNTLFFEA